MFSVLERYILKEIFQTLLGVSFVLLIIVISVSLVRYLGDAASGDIPSNLIFTLITLKGLKYFFTLILPISLYLAFLLALGRLYRDNEMVAINAAGIGPGKLFKIAVMISLPLTLLSIWVMLFIVPKTVLIGYQIVDNASQKMEVTGLSASRFKEVGGGRQVIYVEEISEDRKIAKNVFIYTKQNNRDIVFSAAVSKITYNEIGERYLVLVNGYRYDGTPGEADYRTSYYKEHAVKLISNVEFSKSGKRDWKPTRELLKSKNSDDIAELQWRISLPLSVFFLSLFAIPISKANPRQGRYGKLMVAMLACIAYYILLNLSKSQVSKGILSPMLGMWWVHMLMFASTLLLLGKQLGYSWLFTSKRKIARKNQ